MGRLRFLAKSAKALHRPLKLYFTMGALKERKDVSFPSSTLGLFNSPEFQDGMQGTGSFCVSNPGMKKYKYREDLSDRDPPSLYNHIRICLYI
ncbi:hypothetical protein JOD24_002065 [Kroppenstedtia sanguinis]